MRNSSLGAELMTEKMSVGQQIRRLVEGIVTLGLGSAFAYGFWQFLQGRQNPDATTVMGIIMFSGMCLLFLVPGLVFLKDFFTAFGHEISVYENGIEHRYMGKPQTWTWNELEALTYHSQGQAATVGGIPFYKFHYFDMYLRDKNKKQIRIGKSYNNYQKLANLIMRLTAEVWAKRDFKAIQMGETLRYDNISVGKQGIQQGKKSIAWKAIQGLELNEVTQGIKIIPVGEKRSLFNMGSKAINTSLNDHWNAHVFLRLVQMVLEIRNSKSVA